MVIIALLQKSSIECGRQKKMENARNESAAVSSLTHIEIALGWQEKWYAAPSIYKYGHFLMVKQAS